ncbi:MAG: efflux RND transporter periplasmic adaptor subunit [Gemmatimonadota bacterium]|nr:efflux RND transporter periplasmic adaptor subunit [Gemmatimonadota bacterium]
MLSSSRARRALLLASLSFLSVAMGGCRKSSAATTAENGPDAATDVRVVGNELTLPPADPRIAHLVTVPAVPSVTDSLRIPGRVVWDDDATVRVFSPFAGRVERVVAQVGQRVNAGDVLAWIAAPDYGQAQADAHRATTDLALAGRTVDRTRDLLEHGVAARKDLESAEADLERARTEQGRAISRLAMYGADTTGLNKSFALRAPLAGQIVERTLSPGQEVRPDQMLANAPQLFAPLFVITNPARAWVILDVPERELPYIANGAALSVQPSAWPDRSFPGRVTFVAGGIDPATRTLKVRGTVDNAQGLLKSEMLVSVQLASATTLGVGVPVSAVMLEGAQHVVYVEEGRGRLRRVEVTVGSTQHGLVQVLSGLTEGQHVVTSNVLLVEQLYQQARKSW